MAVNPPRGPEYRMVLLVLVTFYVLAGLCTLGIVWFIRGRRAFMLRPRVSQWRRAWVIFGLVGAVHALFGLTLFSVFN